MATLNLNEKKIPSAENLRLLSSLILSLSSKQGTIENKLINNWVASTAYIKDESFVIYDELLYVCKISNADDTFDKNKWTCLSPVIEELTKSDIEALVNLTPEQITNLQSLIDDTSISVTHTNSSSHIYMAIQDAIAECKDDTLKQIAKKVSGSYKIANTTADIVSADYIYLLSNGTNYDLYVLVDGTATKVGDTNIDLSEYIKTTDLADYMKTSDADGKFATITTVDGKVDKTDIVDNLTSTDTDKPLSANQGKVLKDEVDLKAEIDDTQSSITTVYSSDKVDKITSNIECISITKTQELDFNNLIPTENTKEKTFVHIYSSDMINAPNNEVTHWIVKASIIDTEIRQTAMATHSNAVYVRSTPDGTDWTDWQRLCATSVADVNKTYLNLNTMSNITFGNISGFYLVSNGFCTVDISFNCTTSAPIEWETAYDSLPKPKSVFHMSAPASWSDTAPLLINVNTNGTMEWYIGSTVTANSTYYVNFTYPVAEN